MCLVSWHLYCRITSEYCPSACSYQVHHLDQPVLRAHYEFATSSNITISHSPYVSFLHRSSILSARQCWQVFGVVVVVPAAAALVYFLHSISAAAAQSCLRLKTRSPANLPGHRLTWAVDQGHDYTADSSPPLTRLASSVEKKVSRTPGHRLPIAGSYIESSAAAARRRWSSVGTRFEPTTAVSACQRCCSETRVAIHDD